MDTSTPKRRFIIAASGLVLLVLAYFAAAGMLDWINRPANEAETAALAEQAELNTQLLQDQISEQLTSGPISEEQERLDSPIGQALMQQCLEWTDFHENHPSDSTLENREASCGEFNEYIATGAVPE
jgi:hypothetical protein